MDKIIQEWFTKGKSDLKEAEFLLKHKRPLCNVAFFIHQAAEKYLKGFLIAKGWELEKIHNLEKLVDECIKINPSFKKFVEPLRRITRYYFESRYPIGYDVEYKTREIREDLDTVKEIAKTVNKEVLKK